MDSPLISCYTVIGRDLRLLKIWLHSIESRAGISRDQFDVNLILWNPAEDVLNYVVENNYRHRVMSFPKAPPGTSDGELVKQYIVNLYVCFDAGYHLCQGKYVLRSGSDQIFSNNYLKNSMQLIEQYEKETGGTALFHLYGVESYEGVNETYGFTNTRHIPMPLVWVDKYNPNYEQFDKLCEALTWDKILTNEQYRLMFKHPTRGYIPHSQGPSWIQRRDLYTSSEGYLSLMKRTGFTGDVIWMDYMESMRVPSVLLHNAFTLHRVRGESS